MRAVFWEMQKAYKMLDKARELLGVLEAPLAYVQPLHPTADKFFRVEGRVPRLDQQRAEDDLENVRGRCRLLDNGTCRAQGHVILHGHICGHWKRKRGSRAWRDDALRDGDRL